MPNIKTSKNRITSVKNTRKITNAMYLISSSKLRKAKEELAHTRPYFERTELEIKRVFQSTSGVKSPYFYPEDRKKKKAETFGYLVITADKGLAGAYNHNVIKKAEERLKLHPDSKLYVVGDVGMRYFKKHHYPVEESFFYAAMRPTFPRAREIASVLLDAYTSGEVDEIHIIYSDMENELSSDVRRVRLLPFERKEFISEEEKDHVSGKEYRFEPSPEKVLERLMPSYVAGYIYGALVDSFSAEHNARMNAMSNANNNAQELLDKLYLEYNRLRQAIITQEITEVCGGARAQKKKRKKKKYDESA
ncbi:MAG: ATP synthase F1 subunit gamma [Lachnospiraceae bacterium]|nr:ATP synthase F1 subunit gamma [Lachnospiraceae bacterium]